MDNYYQAVLHGSSIVTTIMCLGSPISVTSLMIGSMFTNCVYVIIRLCSPTVYSNKFANCVNAKFSSCGKLLLLHVHGVFTNYMLLVNIIVDHKYKVVHPIGFQLNMLNTASASKVGQN